MKSPTNDGKHRRRQALNVRADLEAANFITTASKADLIETWKECAKLAETEHSFGAAKLMVAAGKEMVRRGYITDEKMLTFITEMESVIENDKDKP